MTTIIVIGGIGAVVSALVGTAWYSGATPMGKWHMQYLGFDRLSVEEQAKMMADAKPRMWKTYAAQMFLSFLTSVFIAFVTLLTVQNGGAATSVYYYVLMIWAAFTVPMVGQNILWGTSQGSLAWKRFFSESISSLITFLIVAFVATLFV